MRFVSTLLVLSNLKVCPVEESIATRCLATAQDGGSKLAELCHEHVAPAELVSGARQCSPVLQHAPG